MTSQHDTLSKAESARINGAKSTGPVTPEGKANSANGNLKHGAYSKRVLMDGESAQGYEFFKSCFVQHFKPTDPFEAECVESIVTARWRIRRLESAETTSLNIALHSNKEANAAKFDALDVVHEQGIAVQSQIAFIEASTRVQERLHRIHDRNYKLLANYRRKSGRSIPSSEPAVPEPVVSEPVVSEPCPSATGPDLTNQPTAEPSPSSPAATIVTKVAMFLVIFSLLLLTPVTAKAKALAGRTSPSAFHAAASPNSRIQR